MQLAVTVSSALVRIAGFDPGKSQNDRTRWVVYHGRHDEIKWIWCSLAGLDLEQLKKIG